MLDNNLTSIIQSKDDINQYVLAIVNNKMYIFSSKGKYLFQITHTLLSDFPTDFIYNYYSLLYYKYNNNIYYYIISFLNNQTKFRLIEFEINMDTHSYQVAKQKTDTINNVISDSISCQISIDTRTSDKNLACFYMADDFKASFSLYGIENNLNRIRNEKINEINVQGGNNHLIKSVVGEDGTLAIIDIIHPGISTNNWFAFNMNSLQLIGDLNFGSNCLQGTYLNNIYYFNYINQYSFI